MFLLGLRVRESVLLDGLEIVLLGDVFVRMISFGVIMWFGIYVGWVGGGWLLYDGILVVLVLDEFVLVGRVNIVLKRVRVEVIVVKVCILVNVMW